MGEQIMLLAWVQIPALLGQHVNSAKLSFLNGPFLFQSADIRIDIDHPFHRGSPYTQQSRACGQPADFMAIPAKFLVEWNKTMETWGNPAKVFVHEWAKLRYGIFDEFGFSGKN